jgi:UDP-N-acetylmuramyl tripeptide synthase
MSTSRRVAARAGQLSRRLGLGTGQTVAGRLALHWEPEILRSLSAHRETVLISGTNGKTTTTRLLAEALALDHVVESNATGSNLHQGLVGALLTAAPTAMAVLEVDEVVLPMALAACAPTVVLLLNLSRDQLDRTSEVAGHAARWAQALTTNAKCIIVANADDPTIAFAVRQARPDGQEVLWVRAGQPWRDDVSVCPSCGAGWDGTRDDWACLTCGAQRPETDWQLQDGRALAPSGQYELSLQLPGRANQANAVMALAAAASLGVSPERSLPTFRAVRAVEGRYAQSDVQGRQVRLLLAKNPAGWQELLHPADGLASSIVIAFNARAADGLDPSWLYDIPIEVLRGRQVVVLGERATDISVRLHYANVPHSLASNLRQALLMLPAGRCDVLANYTAFVSARRVLAKLK